MATENFANSCLNAGFEPPAALECARRNDRPKKIAGQRNDAKRIQA